MPTPEALPSLWENGRVAKDEWSFVGDDDLLPPTGKIVVSKARYLADGAQLVGRNDPVGVYLESGEPIGALENHLERIELIALRFPRYADGRNYSTARILRDRLGFRGRIRARGDVLRDQIGFMRRAGFDSFEISHAATLAALREGKAEAIRRHYQPSSAGGEGAPDGYAWRRYIPGN
jgi:uncharacterized protein (DUF934 family)